MIELHSDSDCESDDNLRPHFEKLPLTQEQVKDTFHQFICALTFRKISSQDLGKGTHPHLAKPWTNSGSQPLQSRNT